MYHCCISLLQDATPHLTQILNFGPGAKRRRPYLRGAKVLLGYIFLTGRVVVGGENQGHASCFKGAPVESRGNAPAKMAIVALSLTRGYRMGYIPIRGNASTGQYLYISQHKDSRAMLPRVYNCFVTYS